MVSPILQVKSLTKAYETTYGELLVVDNINFSVMPGEFVCIVGPSGSGKTTLLQMLGGLLTPTEGAVLLAGQPLVAPPQEISMVFQKPNLMPWRTVLDNVTLPLQIQGVPRQEANEKGQRILQLVGLSEFAQAHPRELSGGMEQRVAVAGAGAAASYSPAG